MLFFMYDNYKYIDNSLKIILSYSLKRRILKSLFRCVRSWVDSEH